MFMGFLLAASLAVVTAAPAVAAPAVAAPAHAQRINFKAGATSATVSGRLTSNGLKEYLVRAFKGQTMTVSVASARKDMVLEIYGRSDGVPLVRVAAGATSWKGKLTATQDYSIKVVATGSAGKYTMKVSIPPAGSTSGPTRIRFPRNATSVSYENSVTAGGVKQYIIGARAGSLLMVDVTSPGDQVHLAIIGVRTGEPLITTAADATHFEGRLPATQDYLIKLVSSAGRALRYGLSVEIPHRIAFARGATSAEVEGVDVNGRNAYVLSAFANQRMSVEAVSSDGSIKLSIYGLDDGIPLVRSAAGLSSWSGNLPASQDYIIMTVPTGRTRAYTLRVTIQ
jgi:hypothetical protein